MVQILYNTGAIDARQRADHPYKNVLFAEPRGVRHVSTVERHVDE